MVNGARGTTESAAAPYRPVKAFEKEGRRRRGWGRRPSGGKTSKERRHSTHLPTVDTPLAEQTTPAPPDHHLAPRCEKNAMLFLSKTRTLASHRLFSFQTMRPPFRAALPSHPRPRACHLRAHQLSVRRQTPCPRRDRPAGTRTQPPACATPASAAPTCRRATPRPARHGAGAARPCGRRRTAGRLSQNPPRAARSNATARQRRCCAATALFFRKPAPPCHLPSGWSHQNTLRELEACYL